MAIFTAAAGGMKNREVMLSINENSGQRRPDGAGFASGSLLNTDKDYQANPALANQNMFYNAKQWELIKGVCPDPVVRGDITYYYFKGDITTMKGMDKEDPEKPGEYIKGSGERMPGIVVATDPKKQEKYTLEPLGRTLTLDDINRHFELADMAKAAKAAEKQEQTKAKAAAKPKAKRSAKKAPAVELDAPEIDGMEPSM